MLAGEVALSGRLRAAMRADRRLAEARRLGFTRLVTGPTRGERQAARTDGLHVAATIRDALEQSLDT